MNALSPLSKRPWHPTGPRYSDRFQWKLVKLKLKLLLKLVIRRKKLKKLIRRKNPFSLITNNLDRDSHPMPFLVTRSSILTFLHPLSLWFLKLLKELVLKMNLNNSNIQSLFPSKKSSQLSLRMFMLILTQSLYRFKSVLKTVDISPPLWKRFSKMGHSSNKLFRWKKLVWEFRSQSVQWCQLKLRSMKRGTIAWPLSKNPSKLTYRPRKKPCVVNVTSPSSRTSIMIQRPMRTPKYTSTDTLG